MDGMGAVAARSASADAMAQASTVVESATTLAATSMGDGEGCKISVRTALCSCKTLAVLAQTAKLTLTA